jgi:hypothetical protein
VSWTLLVLQQQLFSRLLSLRQLVLKLIIQKITDRDLATIESDLLLQTLFHQQLFCRIRQVRALEFLSIRRISFVLHLCTHPADLILFTTTQQQPL